MLTQYSVPQVVVAGVLRQIANTRENVLEWIAQRPTDEAMGFLDNLENSLKSLETTEERDGSAQVRRNEERARALAEAPWAERLKNSDFTKRLFDEAAAAGHRIRAKVYMAWLDGTLRLDARERRLELRPTQDGIIAVFVEADGQSQTKQIDLGGDPKALITEWLG